MAEREGKERRFSNRRLGPEGRLEKRPSLIAVQKVRCALRAPNRQIRLDAGRRGAYQKFFSLL